MTFLKNIYIIVKLVFCLFFPQITKGSVQELWHIIYGEKDCLFPFYTLMHIPRVIKKTLSQRYHGRRSKTFLAMCSCRYFNSFISSCLRILICFILFILFSFSVKLLNSHQMENIIMEKHSLTYIMIQFQQQQ